MNSIKLKSRAKVNLSIDVLGKRQDGYHLVEMIMQTIDLYDLIEINEKDNDQITIKVMCLLYNIYRAKARCNNSSTF